MHAATGRLSSRKPNAQQVPRRGDDALALRRLFQAPEGKKLVKADFSAVEMRIMARLSEDETMMSAFKEGQDLHSLTASRISGQPLGRITKAQRDAAKVVNFLLIYGGSAETLQWRALSDYGIVMSLEEAHEAVAKYFDVYLGCSGMAGEADQGDELHPQALLPRFRAGLLRSAPDLHFHSPGPEEGVAQVRCRAQGLEVPALQHTLSRHRRGPHKVGHVRAGDRLSSEDV